jgi:hypothetical protein
VPKRDISEARPSQLSRLLSPPCWNKSSVLICMLSCPEKLRLKLNDRFCDMPCRWVRLQSSRPPRR